MEVSQMFFEVEGWSCLDFNLSSTSELHYFISVSPFDSYTVALITVTFAISIPW